MARFFRGVGEDWSLNSAEQYLQAINHVRSTVLDLIESEKKDLASEVQINEVDRLFEHVINLPGESAAFYRCRLMITEALEDLRVSFEARREPSNLPAGLHGSYWQSKRASYLLKIQAAEEAVKGLPE